MRTLKPPNEPLATLNARIPTLDGVTIECLLNLNISHELESASIAIPIQESSNVKSCIFLPILKQDVPDLNDFNVIVWAYLLVDSIRNSLILPKDLKLEPRQMEYMIIYALISFREKLCSQLTNEVTKKSLNEALIQKIRSIYWIIRALLSKNLRLSTPEPVRIIV